MSTKFETNVATQIPKTKLSQEPQLPWEIKTSDLDEGLFLKDSSKKELIKKPPLGARPAFMILLLLFIFVSVVYLSLLFTHETKKADLDIKEKERMVSLLLNDLRDASSKKAELEGEKMKLEDERAKLAEKAQSLERNLKTMDAQNKSFVAIIENLSNEAQGKR